VTAKLLDHGLITQKSRDRFARSLNKSGIKNYFRKGNLMDSLHVRWTTAGSHGPPWTGGGADRRAPWCSGALTEARPPATPGHESSPAGAEKREGSTGVPSQASSGLRQRCGGRVMVMKRWWKRNSAAAAHKLGRRSEGCEKDR
jgi:hypothetical protein